MASFTVIRIIDGDTFDVSPDWTWNGQVGSRVRPTGYNAPEIGTPYSSIATARLRLLIGGKTVVLSNPRTLDRGRLVCDVFVNGVNLATHFSPWRV